jgi:hypothetical protein
MANSRWRTRGRRGREDGGGVVRVGFGFEPESSAVWTLSWAGGNVRALGHFF